MIKNNFDIILENQYCFKKLINETKKKANILTRLDTFEYVFICIDKFIEKEKKLKDFKIKNDMIDLINNVSNKYLVLLNGIQIDNNINEKELYEVTSKLIYLNYEYNTGKEFSLSEINQIGLLNDIYSHFLNKYEISDLYFDNLISDLIKKGKFDKIYNVLIEEKYFAKFEKLLNKFIIKYEELFIKNHFNFLLIVDLYKKKFFDLFKSSSYAKKSVEQLQIIINKINNMNNIPLKQLEFLLNEKQIIDFFSMIDKDGFLKNNFVENLEKNISELKSMIEIKYSDEFLLLNDYQKIKFSDQNKIIESITKFIEEIEQGNISGIDSLKKKFYKIKYELNLIKELQNKISSNYFFKSIQEKKMDISFFEKVIKIFDATKNDEINSDLIPLFDEFLFLDSEVKEKIINDLNDCNNLLNIIYLNSDFESEKEFDKYVYNKINDNEMIKINKKIALIIIKYKIKDIYNNYISFQGKLNLKKKGRKKKNKKSKNTINIMQMFDTFLSSLGIKEEIIYKNINNIINEIMNKKFIKILNLLYKNSEAINFLFSITSQDCRNIQELAGEVHGGNNQNFLSIEELLIIEKLVESLEFIQTEIKNGLDENKKNEDKIIMEITQEQFEEEDLEKYLNKYQQYKEFFSENLDKKKFTAEIIQKILNKSEFLILNSDEENFEAFYKNEEKDGQDIYKGISYDYLIYLRDRALTRNKINDSLLEKKDEFIKNIKQEEQIILENNKIFVEIVRQINELMKHLNKISQKGFFFNFIENKEKKSSFEIIDKINNILLLKIKIKKDSCNIQFFLNESEYRNFNEINEVVKNIYENICTIQRNSCLKKKYINFIHGKQFHLFLDYFLNKNKNENFYYYLNYFTNKEKYILNDFDYKNNEFNIKNENFYRNFIEQCESFLDKILKDNGLTLENIYQQNKIKEEFKDFKGIFLNGSEKLENEIICLYKYFTNNIPLASTLLFCKKDTSIEEITSFIIRAILCEYPIFFCLAKTDFLSEEKKNYILETIIDLIGRVKDENNKLFKMNSCLVIINDNLEDDLCKSLFRLKYIKTLDIPQERKNKIKLFEENDNYNVIVISSDYSGIGKSTYIKNKVKEENYINFPIGGIFSKENTLKRLQNLNREKNINDTDKNLLMHVDLYDTDKISLMNDFLYFVLFTKLYGQDNNIFYLSKKIRIYLEIPNSFINFFDKFPILSLFPKKKLSRDSLEELLVPKDICSHIKIVSLYLKLLKEENTLPEKTPQGFKAGNKIDKNEIVFPFTPPDIILKDENGFDYNKIVIKAENENKYLTSKLCQKLILEELSKTIKKPTYYQITTFINVLASQLIQFNRNYFLSACSILDSGRFHNCCVRSLIVKKFIELTSYFTKGAFTELLNEQEIVQTLMQSKGKEKEKIEKANKLLEECKHDSISFNNMNNLALVFFHGGDNSNFFSIITNKKTNKQTYKDLLNLKNFQSGNDIINQINIKDKNKLKLDRIKKLNDYNKFTQKDFLEELKSILDIKNPIEKKGDNNEMISLSEITKDYVFTEDNFIKMCLILIRLRADIPVIMMGETGCGKTSLIRKLSEMQNNGKCLLVIDNIHAGHTNEDIINFIESKVIPEAKTLAEKEKIIKEKYSKVGQIYEEKKLWVFFDELNTCKSMDLLSEIICKHSCQGKKLPENIVFIGAVNPYRKSKQKKAGLKINNNDDNEESDLLYTVNPMPHSLLNFVFDFGSLNSEDEKRYIQNIVKEKILEEDLSTFTTELIAIAQNFIREKNGVSSVSLREIRRFIIFYEFFIDYLKKRKENITEENMVENENDLIKYSNISEKEIKLFSINLSIYLGYYLRLTDVSEENQDGLRKILFKKLNDIFEKKSGFNFLLIPEKEENFIADNVEMEKGIAKNRALLENLFSLFVAINTKIPIFIIGKPGCSKSLSVQLINNAMKGISSVNPFFRKYPKMYVSTFQGALNSTSEGVKEVFDKAREILKVKDNKEYKEKISTFYFDEMGLAEHSPHNPLKVIHSELEYDLNEDNKKISFLGVSNWCLDSAKMNRGMSINIPDPNESDIQKTSITIAESYLGKNLSENIKIFFENLGSSFFKYKHELRKNKNFKKFENFHGNRDFYHLIKYPATKIKEAQKNNQNIDNKFLAKLAIISLERNFGGLIINNNGKYYNGINLISEKLSESDIEIGKLLKEYNYSIKDKIKNNLVEYIDGYTSRYLLLITRTNIGIYLLSSFIKSIYGNNDFNNYTILIGSIFIDDVLKEEYTTKILSKIKMNMEKDTILILKNFESIYPSLYDLFNQNFVKVKGKKYARIALGNKTNSFSEVNQKFRSVIIVDEDKIHEQEIPFLNRFEKQNISFEYLMNDNQILIAKKLYDKCIKIITYDENKIKLINYDINNLLINCGEEEILGFVYMETQGKEEINEEEYNRIENKFISKIGITLPQDIILILLLESKNWEDNEENRKFYNKLLEYYKNNTFNNLKNFLTNYEMNNKGNKIIIYTFTNIIESINNENAFSYEIKSIGEINKNNLRQIRISSIQNEFELETEVEEFLENNDLKIFIFNLLPFESEKIDYLKAIIENKETEYKNKFQKDINKLFIFLIHVERINKKDLENQYKEHMDFVKKKLLIHTLSNLAGYYQIFIDDINGQNYYDDENKIISLDKILKMKNNDIYKSFINLETIFQENLNNSLCLFDFNFIFDEGKNNKDIYITNLIELFIEDNHLLSLLNGKIMENINMKYTNKNENIFEKIIKEEKFSQGDICIYDIIKKVLNKNYLNEFKILYIELENNYYFSSLLSNKVKYINNKNEKDEIFYKNIKEIFIKDVDIKNKIPENEINIDIIIGYSLPSKNLIEKINYNITNNVVGQYREIEEEFKNKYIEEETPEKFEEESQINKNNIELLNTNIQDIVRKIPTVKEIESALAKGEKIEFYKLLLDDYLLTFINKNIKRIELKEIKSIKAFIKIILENKFSFNENSLDLKNLSTQLNWLESYSLEIISIIQMYIFLNSFENENDLIDKIKNIISELNEEYNNNNIIPKTIKIINRVFYIIIGSLIRILISDLNQILSDINNQISLDKLLDNLNNIYYSLLSTNNALNIGSKEIHQFHETIKIISILSFNEKEGEMEQNKKLMIDFIQKKIISGGEKINKNIEGPKLKKEKENNIEIEDTEEEKNLKNNLDNFYNYYKEKNNINFASLFSSVLFDEFNKENNEKYRQYILNKILSDDNLIPYNILIIKIILTEYIKPYKESIDVALDYISSEEIYFPLLNDSNKEIVNKNIEKIFELIINLYFNSLDNLKDHIITDLLDIFKEYLQSLTDENYEKYYNNYCNENLVKIFELCFIKIYLNKFIMFLCDEKTALQGKEKEIIDIISDYSPFYNTIKLYFIMLIYKKTNSLEILTDISYEKIYDFSNNLKNEIGQEKFDEILTKSLMINDDKYLYNEFFSYINYPSSDNFKSKFLSSNENKEKYPLLNEYIKFESGPINLKYLIDYNNFINLMINYYSGRISRKDAKDGEKTLNLEPIYKNNEFDFQNKFNKFLSIWNNILSQYLKNNNNSDKFLKNFSGNERLAYFLMDDNDKDYGIFIAKGLQLFIQWQNSFLKPIINSYKSKKNNLLNCYVSQIEKTVNVQNANNLQILQIEKCFEKTYYINFEELCSIYSERKDDNLNDFNYNFEKIEEELGKSLLPNKCLFSEKNIKYICYQNEGFRSINYDYLIKFGKIYGEKELTEGERKKIFVYSNKEFNNFDILYDSFIMLVNHLNNDISVKKETKIIDVINKLKQKYFNFHNQFINYFTFDGKDITVEKLLNSFLYMEHVCFGRLKDKIDKTFKDSYDKGQKEEIKNYFNSKDKDNIIKKKEISTAVRRFITRYLINDEKKESIDANLSLYICLGRKYLWNNKIFSLIGENLNDLIKQYLGNFSFPLEIKHALEFYNIIGEEEEKFMREEIDKFSENGTKPKDNLINETQKKLGANVLGMGMKNLGKKEGIKPKMKTKK